MEIFNSIFLELSNILSIINSEISQLFRELKKEDSFITTLTIYGFSFIYGIIHAIGPGHGKLLVSAYLIKKEYSYKKAFKLGYMISIIHTLSALIITLAIYYIFESRIRKSFAEATEITGIIAGVIILLIGIYLTYSDWKERNETDIGSSLSKSDFSIALSAGIVPCPGVMTILVFSAIISQIYVGIIAAILMSIGMGLTISIVGLISSSGKKIINKKVGEILSILSSILIIFLGIAILIFQLK